MINKIKVITWVESVDEAKDLKIILQEHFYECLSCKNRTELEDLIKFHHHAIGLLIIDSKINEVNVPDLCSYLKTNHFLDAHLMVIGQMNDSDTEVIMYEHGADFFIHRPLKKSLLIKRIDAVMNRKS